MSLKCFGCEANLDKATNIPLKMIRGIQILVCHLCDECYLKVLSNQHDKTKLDFFVQNGDGVNKILNQEET